MLRVPSFDVSHSPMWLASLMRREPRGMAGILVCLLDPEQKTWIHVHIMT